jgi:RNA recognition motif-containing protein
MVTRTKKIFVGGLSAPTTLEDVKSYFEQFGTVSKKKKFFCAFKSMQNLIFEFKFKHKISSSTTQIITHDYHPLDEEIGNKKEEEEVKTSACS